MVKKPKTNKRRIGWDNYLNSSNANKKNKPIPTIVLVIFAVVVTIALLLLVLMADYLSNNQATILGILGSTAISVFIVFFTVGRERRQEYRDAQKSAKLLSDILRSVDEQISRIQNGNNDLVYYPDNWFEHYSNCVSFLDYDYSEVLLHEFSFADKINSSIECDNKETIAGIIMDRKRLLTDQWSLDFDHLTTRYNLLLFSSGHKELKPWKLDSNYISFKRFFFENYTNKTIELTEEYLRHHDGLASSNDASFYVMNELRKEAALQSGKYKFESLNNKMMLSVISQIYISLKSDAPFSLCFGELRSRSNS